MTNVGRLTGPADYYLGRGPDAIYLGTQMDWGGPCEATWQRFQSITDQEYTAEHYQEKVALAVDRTTWPHEHADSASTPWTYAYDQGTVYVYRYGVEMAAIRCNHRRWVPGHIADPTNGDPDQEEFIPRKASKFPTHTQEAPA